MSESENTGGPSDPNPDDLLKPIAARKVRTKTTKFLEDGSPLAKPHLFTPRHLRFLEVYTETLDVEAALAETGMTRYQVQKSEYLLREIQLINEASMLKHRAKSALGRHERLMEKFEGVFDRSGDAKVRSSMASTLARMSEASLRASGEFQEKPDDMGLSAVQVVINIGGAAAETPPDSVVLEVSPSQEDL